MALLQRFISTGDRLSRTSNAGFMDPALELDVLTSVIFDMTGGKHGKGATAGVVAFSFLA